LILRDVFRQHVLERRHAGFLGQLVLAADIDLARRIAADQHHRKPRNYPVLTLYPRNLGSDPAAQFGGNEFSIDNSGRHLDPC
jgi:hypothetical protein